ncbi:RsmF rRNA methyltransferase first C-terminal domain-containing protein [Xylanivirga thermophila]|jgi:NOL1/NOP2/sun family putative RNA methylase|uniref:RsmF rRNA methyltransferase first C-terminal domain-containing protein n=1 Tax=Xylanivirga thermophila TaxID=2496273 RepID=UPI00101C572A|nr:RsmF rRNA methyltransferase first C-terminal domain-containing protein [Xylanivirga thermophila]
MELQALPRDFVDRMKKQLGDESQVFFESYGKGEHKGLRVNTLKIPVDDFVSISPFNMEHVPWTPDGFYYLPESQPGKHPYHAAGLYYIQEPSAMAPVQLLSVKPGDKVLDLCAAPGGKSAQIGAALKGEGVLISNEIHPSRVLALGQNLERMGIKNVVITNESPKKLADKFNGFFDKILVDAPCSGEGMFRKDRDARDEWSISNVEKCALRQEEILDYASSMLKPGGRMVYSTCTFSFGENEGNIKKFLNNHRDFYMENLTYPYDVSIDKGYMEGTYRIWPHRQKGEGHFMAILGKKGEFVPDYGYIPDDIGNEKQITPFLDFVADVLTDTWDIKKIYLKDGKLYFIPVDISLLKGLKVLRPGLYMGEIRKKRFIPSHALALSLRREQVKRYVDLSAKGEDILKYMQGNVISMDVKNGWTLVLVDGYSIGWAKAVDGMLKNHYPKGLRIS